MVNERLRLGMTTLHSPKAGDPVLQFIVTIRRLRSVRVTRFALPRLSPGDVYVFRRREHLSVFSIRDLVVVERGCLAQPQPGVEGQHGDGTMVAMRIYRPLREEDIRLLRRNQVAELVVPGDRDRRFAIGLRSKHGTRLEDSTSSVCLRYANGGALLRALTGATLLAAIEIQEGDL